MCSACTCTYMVPTTCMCVPGNLHHLAHPGGCRASTVITPRVQVDPPPHSVGPRARLHQATLFRTPSREYSTRALCHGGGACLHVASGSGCQSRRRTPVGQHRDRARRGEARRGRASYTKQARQPPLGWAGACCAMADSAGGRAHFDVGRHHNVNRAIRIYLLISSSAIHDLMNKI